jgi:hypothetical protein
MTFITPELKSNFNPIDGFGDAKILKNSSVIRSCEIISNRSANS